MNFLRKFSKRRKGKSYDLGIFPNQFDNQLNPPELYRTFDDYQEQVAPFQQIAPINGWNGCQNQPFYEDQNFHQNPVQQIAPYYGFPFYPNFVENRPIDNSNFNFSNGCQPFNGNDQCYTNNKRAREEYYDEDLNLAKRQRLTGPCVEYAIKKCSQYPQPMRKVLDMLFESEITADGWEKINGMFLYHTKIREKYYYQSGISIDIARELVAEAALKELHNFKFEKISWPQTISSFRLEQHSADEIETLVKNSYDDVMKNNLRYKTFKVLSAIVQTSNDLRSKSKVVAFGTGTKCLSDKCQDKDGTILHDMHAEILARRSFVRFLYDQLIELVNEKPSIFILNGESIQLEADIKFQLYVNTIPCGDARVFSLKGCAKLKKEAKQGALRTKKIGGTDIISKSNTKREKSMSCSDKMARWNVLGLQGAALTKYIQPIYLESIVLGSRYVPFHLHRALFGRLERSVADTSFTDGYRLNKPKFESTFVMETTNFAATEDYGVCWSQGYDPEILNLNTGLNNSGEPSKVSKSSFVNLLQSLDGKLSNIPNAGIPKYHEIKKIFYSALQEKNLGVWESKSD